MPAVPAIPPDIPIPAHLEIAEALRAEAVSVRLLRAPENADGGLRRPTVRQCRAAAARPIPGSGGCPSDRVSPATRGKAPARQAAKSPGIWPRRLGGGC